MPKRKKKSMSNHITKADKSSVQTHMTLNGMDNFQSLRRIAVDLATNSNHTKWLCPLLILVEVVLCTLIIQYVPYTEIDWQAYMSQVSQYMLGERNYPKITGGTGPLVYPAAHVYTYSALWWITDEGRDILTAQIVFAGVYLVGLTAVFAVYRKAGVPPYVYPLLILSKRTHSIFLLRLFNDSFAVVFLFLSIFAYQSRLFTVGSLLYSWGLGTKMSLLLSLPGVLISIFLTRGLHTSLKQLWMMAQLQIIIAFPFLPVNAWGYGGRAFEFSRQFLWKWTVNWRFVDEETFLSQGFSKGLLIGHVTLLAVFILTRWLKPAQRDLKSMITHALNFQEPLEGIQSIVARRVTPNVALTTILTSNIIGLVFARSLHYQFYAYLAWSTPFLLWKSGLHPVAQYMLWAAQEWGWNVYPSTEWSSMVVVGVMGFTVAAVWFGTGREEFPEVQEDKKPQWYIK